MARLFKLFISIFSVLLLQLFCKAQVVSCDCDNLHVQDSLKKRYIDNGALKNNYNGPVWQHYCDSLINRCPNIAVAYQLKAIPYLKAGDYAPAFLLNNKAVERDPKQFTAYRGFLKLIFTKDYKGAIVDFQKAQQLTPNGYEMDHTYFFYEALCNLELGDYSKAAALLKKDSFVQVGKDTKKNTHFNTLLYLGIVHYELKEYEKAKSYFLKCLSQYKELPEANYYLALVYGNENNKILKNAYLDKAKKAIANKYGMNEDNMYYAYYPYQITAFEIQREIYAEQQSK